MTMHRRLLLLGAMLAAPAAARAQPDLGAQLVDALEGVFGVHPGARRAHAKGRLYDGRFVPAAAAARLSTAPHFAAETAVILRFSDGPGLPEVPDNSPLAPPAGFAIRFLTPDGKPNDIVVNANEGFPVRTGEDVVAFLRAVAASRPGTPEPTPLQRFIAAHPETQQYFARPHPPAASFATTRYFGNNALIFVAAEGTRRAFRYVLEPEAAVASLTPDEARAKGPNYLFDDLATRLAPGAPPVRFSVVAQMAAPGDPTGDVTALWPAERERITLGTVTITREHADQTEEQRLFYDPNNLPEGIVTSDDPLLPARFQAYGVSIARRTAR